MGGPVDYLQSKEGSGPPNTNLSSGRKEDLNSGPPSPAPYHYHYKQGKQCWDCFSGQARGTKRYHKSRKHGKKKRYRCLLKLVNKKLQMIHFLKISSTAKFPRKPFYVCRKTPTTNSRNGLIKRDQMQ